MHLLLLIPEVAVCFDDGEYGAIVGGIKPRKGVRHQLRQDRIHHQFHLGRLRKRNDDAIVWGSRLLDTWTLNSNDARLSFHWLRRRLRMMTKIRAELGLDSFLGCRWTGADVCASIFVFGLIHIGWYTNVKWMDSPTPLLNISHDCTREYLQYLYAELKWNEAMKRERKEVEDSTSIALVNVESDVSIANNYGRRGQPDGSYLLGTSSKIDDQ